MMQPDIAGIAAQAKRIATTVVGHHSMATANQVLWLAGHLCYLAALVAEDESYCWNWNGKANCPRRSHEGNIA